MICIDNISKSRRPWAMGAVLVLAACSAGTDGGDAPEPDAAQVSGGGAAAVPPPADGPVSTDGASETRGGDGSAIVLTPLSPSEITAADLDGELGCSFAEKAGDAPLLLAMGNVGDRDGHASGLAKIGDYVEPVHAREAGGFDALAKGASFAGRGMTYTVALYGQTPSAGGESPPHPAEMLLQRADGAERVIVGLWTCGP